MKILVLEDHSIPNANMYLFFTSKKGKLATSLRIDYLRGEEAYDLIIDGNLVRLGNRIMVTSMQAFQKDELVAEVEGVYNFFK